MKRNVVERKQNNATVISQKHHQYLKTQNQQNNDLWEAKYLCILLEYPELGNEDFITRIITEALYSDTKEQRHIKTCSGPRRPLFLHALSFECTSKLCITFLNQFSVYFHI